MKNLKLINIIGIDGAGKTTLAKALANELNRSDGKVAYKYCQYFAKLLYPLKFLAKITVMRKTDEFKDYNSYNQTKKSTSSRYPFLANIYALTWLVDYAFQVFFKISLPLMIGKKLVIDRYIYDIALNLSLTTNNQISYAHRLINSFLRIAPIPDLVVFIDLPEEVAFSRKDDIQDIEYLRERRERYLALSDKYHFEVVNGDQTVDELLRDVSQLVMKRDCS